MERTNKIYPIMPRPEWFMFHQTKLSSVSLAGTTTPATEKDWATMSSAMGSSFRKMDAEGYGAYILSMKAWRGECALIDAEEHDAALQRRHLTTHREVVSSFVDTEAGEDGDEEKDIPLPPSRVIVGHGHLPAMRVAVQKKTVHAPTLSTKPHRGEKRDKKKKLRDTKTQVSVNVLEAKTEIAASNTVSTIKEKLTAVQKLKDLRPLHKEELVAAKSAAARSKQIVFGSSDIVTNIDPSDGWKVVTRKWGDFTPLVAQNGSSAGPNPTVHLDPALAGKAHLVNAILRKPTSGGR